ncbi:NERD domain-containing protein [Acinetobacter bohemicus]|uniref:nuclease-related domain-containing protein n=1 Tax=Acinetobacter TaxID=469 RepID=UPI00209B366D|nr:MULTISPECIES: nuclease-related domain-containing protein [Acinetobacter]MCO8042233.1 NERD domain-containing protein [Acinetobacter sp. S4400-12]MCO8045307.1 NERD domain-containing protein [Acinetobacter sp. S4397-1]MCU7224483.1 NERD domain-containing protein [Acinetobacter bohemicus]
MENSTISIFGSLWSNIGWILLLFFGVMIFKLFKPFLKGKLGEFTVAMHAKLYLKDPQYLLLNDLTLPDGEGGTTQIDHLLLSPYGIFVIETKNYKGWIFGNERQKIWTQKIYKNSYKFQNPIHQNYKHIKVLEQLLADSVEPDLLHSVIVFMPDAVFKTPMPPQVFRGAGWTDYVKSFDQPMISGMKLKRIQLRLEKEVLKKSWKTNREHVENLKQRKQL